MSHESQLFTPFRLRSIELKNRVVISPMCQYSAEDGLVNDWHLVHLGRFALGGAGLIIAEATAVEARGRITHGDLGLWSDAHVPGLRRLTTFLKRQGAAPAIQLAHAGRKGSARRPWEGAGPVNEEDASERGERPWETVSASPLAVGAGWPTPRALDEAELANLERAWRDAARRADEAGFDVIELHAAHGYLLHQFLSPVSNTRQDGYGGSLEARCRFPLRVARAVRESWPEDKPMFVRVSAVDGVEGGWTLDDTLYFAAALKELGVDLIDCSSGGLSGSPMATRIPRTFGFQVPFAEAVRRKVGIPSMAVGLIVEADHAESIVRSGQADLVAIGRQALVDPSWALHAEQRLRGEAVFDQWPKQARSYLANRARMLAELER